MDDGSASVEESLQMIDALKNQGVTSIAATLHFYADREDPASFFERRSASYSMLKDKIPSDVSLYLGAEVLYYPGISRTSELPGFTFGKTDFLLLEMPFCDWTKSVINEAVSIQRDRKMQVVIAHIDRYLHFGGMRYIEEMRDSGILFQANANSLLDIKRKNAVLSLIRKNRIFCIASDCHNMDARAPRIDEAYAVIEKKLGRDQADLLRAYSFSIFE